jgi:hypothetical protein
MATASLDLGCLHVSLLAAKNTSKTTIMKNRLISLAAVCAFIPTMLVAQSVEKNELVGVWAVKVTPRNAPGTLLAIDLFGADGSFTHNDDEALPPIPAIQAIGTKRSAAYGRWKRTGDREFKLTFYIEIWKEGVVNGFIRVQRTLTLSESGDEFSGPAKADFCDANWNVVLSLANDVKGKRLETP